MGTVFVTGANGFLGKSICQYLRQQEISFTRLVRRAQFTGDTQWSLGEAFPDGSVPNDSVLVHAAFDFQNIEMNDLASEKLFQTFRDSGGQRIIFISSMSATADADSRYGQSKKATESRLGPADTILRPGFVIGNGGSFQKLVTQISMLPFQPFFFGEKPLQPVAVSDVSAVVVRCCRQPCPGEFNLGSETLPFIEFCRRIAKFRHQVFLPIPMPGFLGVWILETIENLGISFLPLKADSLKGLRGLQEWETSGSWMQLGLHPKKVDEALKEVFSSGQ